MTKTESWTTDILNLPPSLCHGQEKNCRSSDALCFSYRGYSTAQKGKTKTNQNSGNSNQDFVLLDRPQHL